MSCGLRSSAAPECASFPVALLDVNMTGFLALAQVHGQISLQPGPMVRSASPAPSASPEDDGDTTPSLRCLP